MIGASYPSRLWKKVLSTLEASPQDIQTVRLDGKDGKWFYAEVRGELIRISEARIKSPSSALTSSRFINENAFTKIHSLYNEWRKGSVPRTKIRDVNLNSSYILAIIHQFKQG
jgi:hypothetical protein